MALASESTACRLSSKRAARDPESEGEHERHQAQASLLRSARPALSASVWMAPPAMPRHAATQFHRKCADDYGDRENCPDG